MIYKTTNGFGKLSLSVFASTLNTICEKMNGNAYFTKEQPSVADLIEKRNGYTKLAAIASGGDREAILARDEAREKIITALHDLGKDVTATAKNNLLKLESSGFPISREKEPTAPLVKPLAPRVSAGVNIGQIKCVAKKQNPKDTVTFWIGTHPTDRATWRGFTKTKSKFIFIDLVSGQRYYIQYELTGVRDQSVISDVVTYVSQ